MNTRARALMEARAGLEDRLKEEVERRNLSKDLRNRIQEGTYAESPEHWSTEEPRYPISINTHIYKYPYL